MFVKCDVQIQASIDDGLTVTTWEPGESVEVPDWVGEMAIKNLGAKKVKEKPSPETPDQEGEK